MSIWFRSACAVGAFLAIGVIVRTYAQTVAPPTSRGAMVCAYNSSPPTAPSSGIFILVQCNSSGQLLVH